MADVLTLFDESVLQKGFYVPRFEVVVDKSGLPSDVVRDVRQITYKDNVKEIDNFEIVVNNWDAGARAYKYIGSESADSDDPEAAIRWRLFEPCTREVEIRFGYQDELVTMTKAFFTTMAPSFHAAEPTLNVRGLNVLHQLRRKQYSTSWQNLTDTAIVKNLATLPDPKTGQRRFPLPIRTNPGEEQPRPFVAQQNQYDIDFLLSLARRNAYVVRVDQKANGSRELYFGLSDDPNLRAVEYRLAWGRSLMDFQPTLTTANQIRSVTVHGWNRRTKKAIRQKVSLDDRGFTANKDLKELLLRCDPREEEVTSEPVATLAEAKQRARAILLDRTREIIKATGATVGLPNLRAGVFVHIENVGARLSGRYFVTETTHTLGAGGYTTKFAARREDEEAK